MKIVDLNVLLYAVNRDGPEHAPASAWLERTLAGSEPVALPWAVILGFLRVATSPRVFPKPLSPAAAMKVMDHWLAAPAAVTISPEDEHWRILRSLIERSGTAGNLTTDAHLAALAIEHGAELCSTDADFARFPALRWTNPLAG